MEDTLHIHIAAGSYMACQPSTEYDGGLYPHVFTMESHGDQLNAFPSSRRLWNRNMTL